MTYFDELRTSSFRNIEFESFVAADGGGRRGTVNEFPSTNDAQFNDRGRKTKPFVLNAAVFGENALQQANQLEDALNKKGPGKLVHPTRGEMQVTCTDFSRKSVSDAGLRVDFTIEFFKEPDTKTGIKISQNTEKAAAAQERAANEETAKLFAKVFKIQDQPNFVKESAKSDFIKMADVIDGFLGNTGQMVSAFKSKINDLIENPELLIVSVQELVGKSVRVASFSSIENRENLARPTISRVGSSQASPSGLFAPIIASNNFRVVSGAANVFDNVQTLEKFSTDFENISVTTVTRQVQQNNSRASQLAIRMASTVVESELHRGDEGSTLFNTREQAQGGLKLLLKQLQIRKNESADIGQIQSATPDATQLVTISNDISKLMSAAAAVSNHKYGLLADEKIIIIPVDTNSINVAYDLYQDTNREAEIRSRNNLTDTFIPKGQILKVSEQ